MVWAESSRASPKEYSEMVVYMQRYSMICNVRTIRAGWKSPIRMVGISVKPSFQSGDRIMSRLSRRMLAQSVIPQAKHLFHCSTDFKWC